MYWDEFIAWGIWVLFSSVILHINSLHLPDGCCTPKGMKPPWWSHSKPSSTAWIEFIWCEIGSIFKVSCFAHHKWQEDLLLGWALADLEKVKTYRQVWKKAKIGKMTNKPNEMKKRKQQQKRWSKKSLTLLTVRLHVVTHMSLKALVKTLLFSFIFYFISDFFFFFL